MPWYLFPIQVHALVPFLTPAHALVWLVLEQGDTLSPPSLIRFMPWHLSLIKVHAWCELWARDEDFGSCRNC